MKCDVSGPLCGLNADGRPIAAATNARQVGVQLSPAFYDVAMGGQRKKRERLSALTCGNPAGSGSNCCLGNIMNFCVAVIIGKLQT